MTKNLKYSIGLDIGTSSVGWCVTDEENNIVKKVESIYGDQDYLTKDKPQQTLEHLEESEEELKEEKIE